MAKTEVWSKLCRFDSTDTENLETISKRHGRRSTMDAIRFALDFTAKYSEPAGLIPNRRMKKTDGHR